MVVLVVVVLVGPEPDGNELKAHLIFKTVIMHTLRTATVPPFFRRRRASSGPGLDLCGGKLEICTFVCSQLGCVEVKHVS